MLDVRISGVIYRRIIFPGNSYIFILNNTGLTRQATYKNFCSIIKRKTKYPNIRNKNFKPETTTGSDSLDLNLNSSIDHNYALLTLLQ